MRDGSGAVLASGGSVGVQRVVVLPPTRASSLRVALDGGALAAVTGYDTGGATVPGIAYTASTERPD